MKILVTGCAGLLGSNYCRHLIDHGHEVLGVDDLSGGYKDYVPTAENFRFVELDLENTQGVSKFLAITTQMFVFTLPHMQPRVFPRL